MIAGIKRVLFGHQVLRQSALTERLEDYKKVDVDVIYDQQIGIPTWLLRLSSLGSLAAMPLSQLDWPQCIENILNSH